MKYTKDNVKVGLKFKYTSSTYELIRIDAREYHFKNLRTGNVVYLDIENILENFNNGQWVVQHQILTYEIY